MYIKKAIFTIYFLFFCILSYTQSNHTVTIFVHGTFAFRKLVQYSPFRSMIYCKQGLHLAQDLPKSYFFHQIALHCAQNDPSCYSLDRFYIFGWNSEYIYDKTRTKAAQSLVDAMQKLVIDYYKKYNEVPEIQLIGFSHGGNVVLNTANYLPIYVENQQVSIQIWLFGTPVQKINKCLINSPHFTQAYAIYSEKDWMQRMDPQGVRHKQLDFQYFWSDRMFNQTDNCIQVALTVNNKPIAHSYYRYIFKYLPKIQNLVREKVKDKDMKPLSINITL